MIASAMKTIRVRYTVKPSYVETNKQRVRAVMAALRERGISSVKYVCHVEPDGCTFVHLAMLSDPNDNPIPGLPEFAAFRTGLTGNLESPPDTQDWEVVGANFDFG
jgi:hypothetical protein